MKMRKAKIKPFKGFTVLNIDGDETAVVEFLQGMGYIVYEDPANWDVGNVIVSDRTLTYSDLKKAAKRLEIDLDWWNDETDFNDRLNDELDEVR